MSRSSQFPVRHVYVAGLATDTGGALRRLGGRRRRAPGPLRRYVRTHAILIVSLSPGFVTYSRVSYHSYVLALDSGTSNHFPITVEMAMVTLR
jgi:hypothetical protein